MKTKTTSAEHTLPRQRRVVARHGHVALASLVASSFIAIACCVTACSAPGPGVRYKDDDSDMSPFGGNPLGNGGTSGTGQTPGSSMTPGVPGSTENPAVPMDVLIDDLEDGNGNLSAPGFAGRWTTYSDGTSQVTPPADTDIVPVEGAIHVTGSNFNMWGVGLSVDLNNASGTRQPVDLSDFRGLSVRARGTGSVEVELVLPATTGTEEGGTCSGEGCFGHYAARLTLGAAYADHPLAFQDFNQPDWGQTASLDLTKVLAINFLSRAGEGAPSSIDLYVDSLKLLAAPLPTSVTPGSTGTGTGTNPLPGVADGTNPFAGQTFHSDNGAAFNAYNSASGAERDLLGKIAMNPTAFWLVGGDPGQAGRIADGAGSNYPVIVVYNIPNRDCNGQSAGGAGSPQAYEDYVDGVASALQGKRAAIILEPDALALSCGASTESLLSYAVTSLRRNPGTAVYLDGGHSNWIPAGEMANRLRSAGIEQATGFAINVSNFQPTDALIAYGRALSGQLGNKPFVIDTSRNGKGPRGAEWCNPAGAGLGELPTTATGDAAVHALLWVKRPGESDGACGQCGGTPAGQFCRGYALELAQNAVF